ncbi:histone H2B.3-like [Zingiber officinale]|nr:histone H2B.3-like [Zingiber officinale]
MAPKRAKIVRTTKKVVEETVEVLGVAVDSHNSVNLPAESDSKIVEVVVEDEVPISVVVVAKDKKTEPETEQKQRAEEASLETEEPLPKQKGDEDDRSKEKEAAEFIVDMETKEEEGGDEKEEKGEEDQRVEKEAELPTPKKVEKRKEAPVKESKKGGKRRWRRRLGGGEMDGVGGGYKRYVFRVLKQVHPGLGISARAMTVVDCMMGDMFERLANEASQLSTYSGRATLSSREVQGAVQLVLPGELGKHAIAEGSKAVANYMAAASGSGY